MLKVAGSNPVARSTFISAAFAVLLLSASSAGADASSWQLRAGIIPASASPAATSRITLVIMDLGGLEALSSSSPQYSTPSAAEIAAAGGPGAEERLRDRLRSGDGTALVPLVLMLVSRGEIDRATVYMDGMGVRIPANRRDLAIAAAWYGRFSLHPYLAGLPEAPPDLSDDDASPTLAAVVGAGWLELAPDGLFHPEAFVTAADMASVLRAFPSDATVPPGTIWLDQLDPFFREDR